LIGDENELILHAVWAGIFAYFIALGSSTLTYRRPAAGGAGKHGTFARDYDAFSDSSIGVGIAVLSIVIFIAYYRSGEVLQGKLTALLQASPEEVRG